MKFFFGINISKILILNRCPVAELSMDITIYTDITLSVIHFTLEIENCIFQVKNLMPLFLYNLSLQI